MTRPTRAHIDLRNIQHNFNRVQELAPASRIMAVIKANAYGHGLVRIAQALNPADAFGVVGLEEAITLREAGCSQRIVLLEGLFNADDIALINGYCLDVVIHHPTQLEMLEQGRLTRPLDIWLKIDTGMHRLGFAPAEAAAAAERLRALPNAGTLRLMTHLASADEPDVATTSEQMACFAGVVESIPGERTLANSAGILAWPDAHADWVRPGIMLYGGSPFVGQDAQSLGLKPVMTLRSKLIAVNAHRKGDAIGYGGSWRCPADMNIGVAAIGYGDGYPRHAPNGMPVLVNGKRAALAGRVSMDMICIDLGEQPDARVGDDVVLWGEGLPADEVAALAGTLSYELLCGVSARVCYDYV
jgi:alanine racemase